MKKIVFLIISIIFAASVSAQTKSSFSIGCGMAKTHNVMLLPYTFKGINCNIIYDSEKRMNNNWTTWGDAILAVSPFMRIDYDLGTSANGDYSVDFELYLQKSFLKEIVDKNIFHFHAGFAASLQGNYQIFANDYGIYETLAKEFLAFGFSAGISTLFQLQLKKLMFQNHTSYMLLGASLYPNYMDTRPIINGFQDYFTAYTINKRNFVMNKFKIEFPLYINGKFINSFVLSHNLRFEHSTIKDNTYRRFIHTYNLGVIFKINKLNITES